MGVSTDGQICFGILLNEETPWEVVDDDGEKIYEDIEDWWLEIKGFNPPVSYAENWEQWYEYKKNFKKENPLPVTLVNACSGEYPLWILAISVTLIEANRGCPVAFDPAEELITWPNNVKILTDFCQEHEINIGDETPKWWLSSYWG
jgi:hypothetical protein